MGKLATSSSTDSQLVASPCATHFDIKGHDSAFKAIEVAINDDQETQRGIHP